MLALKGIILVLLLLTLGVLRLGIPYRGVSLWRELRGQYSESTTLTVLVVIAGIGVAAWIYLWIR